MYYYNELYHHGIKGQRWGVRRYQNEDGTLTSAGKQRYGDLQIYEKKDKKAYKVARLQTKESYENGEISKSEYRQLSKMIRNEKRNNSIYNRNMVGHVTKSGAAVVGTLLASFGAGIAAQTIREKRGKELGDSWVDLFVSTAAAIGVFAAPAAAIPGFKKSVEDTKNVRNIHDSKQYSK